MADWNCANCGKVISDSHFDRIQQVGFDRFCRGETMFCLTCANDIYDRSKLPKVVFIPEKVGKLD